MQKVWVFIAFALTACSSFDSQKVADLGALIQQNRCAEAAQLAASTNDPVRYNNLGVVAHNCERNIAKARNYYEYGARLGEKMAITNLLNNGWSVPAPDIKASNDAASSAATNNALILLRAAQPQPGRTPIVCDTDKFGNGVQTVCK